MREAAELGDARLELLRLAQPLDVREGAPDALVLGEPRGDKLADREPETLSSAVPDRLPLPQLVTVTLRLRGALSVNDNVAVLESEG